jgi:tetratricopeptide (TPR) repeat protein
LPDGPSPLFRNVASAAEYVGDETCASCHAPQTETYRQHSMSKSFHRWTSSTRVETSMDSSLYHAPTGLSYQVVEDAGALYQVEFIATPDGRRLHELRRRIDHVMGSGHVARTYFTEENGRLFQLPLTWYSRHGWDFSPGYRPNNARFDRVMPDRCIACHSSYPDPFPFLEGKYADARPGIGCERCHGPGALHAAERRRGPAGTGNFDNSIVNPARLPLARRLDTCEQCHVHTAVNVLREGKDALGYMPSQPLRDHWAFFKTTGTIDIVSHADRLRQSPCFLGTFNTSRPLECATCHNPHAPPPDSVARNRPCITCHLPDTLARRLERSDVRDDHTPQANCVGCHMPKMQEQGIPHGTFTEHWIRVVRPGDAPAQVRRANGEPIEPFFERDVTGPDAPIYRAMGKIVYGTLATDARVLTAATTELARVLGNDSTRAGAHFLLGAAYEQLGRIDDAVRAHERSVRIDADRPEALRALAYVYALTGRDPPVVDSLYQRALALQPALAWVRAEHADFLQETGRVAEAERAYREAIREQPSLAVAWFNLGLLRSGAARESDAQTAYHEAVRLDPQSAQALAALFRFTHTADSSITLAAVSLPLTSLPIRDRGPRAVHARVASDSRAVAFVNVPATAIVQIFRPNGTLMRTVRSQGALSVAWDLRTDRGRVIGPGLYRVRVLGRDTGGQPVPPQTLYIGIARGDAPGR